MNSAGGHSHDVAVEFANLLMFKLPPYSPVFNSIEQVGQWLRQNALANKYFGGYEDIIDACCDAWNSFIEDDERVKRLCYRE